MRLPWKKSQTIISHTIWDLKSPNEEYRSRTLAVQPEYADAKRGGDWTAAFSIVDRLFAEGAREMMDKKILPHISEDPYIRRPMVVAPVKLGGNNNLLPVALAHRMAYEYGLDVCRDVVQCQTPKRTGTSAIARLLNQSEFMGSVEKGRKYVVTEDVYATGGGMAALIGHIEAGGGEVICSTVLANQSHIGKAAGRLKPKELTLSITGETLKDIRGNYGWGFDSKFAKAVGFPLEALTNREGSFVAKLFSCQRSFFRAVDDERNRQLEPIPVTRNAGSPHPARRGSAFSGTEPS